MKPESSPRGTSADAILVMDGGGLIIEWTPAAETIFGWQSAEAVGRKLSDLIIPARHRAAHEAGLKRFLATGSGALLGRPIEIVALNRDGREFSVELRISGEQTAAGWRFPASVRLAGERH
jgi:PAS domain S-box-containing protein